MKILVTRRLPYLAEAEEALSEVAELVFAPAADEDALVACAAGVDAILAVKGAPITRRVLAASPGLRVVATPSAGYDFIDVDAATEAAVPVVANTGTAAGAVAEFSLGLIIALTRRIAAGDRALHAGDPYPSVRRRLADEEAGVGVQLHGGTVGVLGLGHVGSAVATAVRAVFSVDVLAHDPHAPPERAAALGVELVDDPIELARRVDVLLVHVALTPETNRMVGEKMLAAMAPTSYLVNCSRGEVVDQQALVRALEEGRLAGAALDVFETEPLPVDSPLRRLDNVILTPHVAGVTRQSDSVRARAVAARLRQALEGEVPEGLVNREAWPAYLERRKGGSGA